jgi:hypothetical protein
LLALREWLNSEKPRRFPAASRKAVKTTFARTLEPSLRAHTLLFVAAAGRYLREERSRKSCVFAGASGAVLSDSSVPRTRLPLSFSVVCLGELLGVDQLPRTLSGWFVLTGDKTPEGSAGALWPEGTRPTLFSCPDIVEGSIAIDSATVVEDWPAIDRVPIEKLRIVER